MYMVFTTIALLEVAIESWPEWDLNHDHWIPFRRSNRLSYQAMSSTHTQSQLCTATLISSFAQCPISFRLLPSSVATFILTEIFLSNHVSEAEWFDTYGIHHWSIIRSNYRKLVNAILVNAIVRLPHRRSGDSHICIYIYFRFIYIYKL